VTANKTVDASDVNLTKGQVGMTVTSANIREDVNANGAINSTDVKQVKANVSHSLP